MSQVETVVHDFQFTLEGAEELTDEILDAIYEAGCDDASFGTTAGVHFGTFHREADSYDEAVASARAAILKAGVGLVVTRVTRLTIFSFQVVLSDLAKVTDELAQALARGGCDDATLGVCRGEIALGFERLDESLGDALSRAIKNVERAGFAVARVEIERS